MTKTRAGKLLESLAALEFDDESGKPEVAEMWKSLDTVGAKTFVSTEVQQYVKTHFTNRLSLKKKEQTGFLRGAVYGFVLAKSGDRQFSIRAASFAVELATRQNREI